MSCIANLLPISSDCSVASIKGPGIQHSGTFWIRSLATHEKDCTHFGLNLTTIETGVFEGKIPESGVILKGTSSCCLDFSECEFVSRSDVVTLRFGA